MIKGKRVRITSGTKIFLCFLGFLLLSSCKKEVPEQREAYYTPDPTKITQKQVKIVSSPLSKYGNLASYKVDGKDYKVLREVDSFKQQGIASWYGPNFHKKRTSSGEVYDMYQMTAAHKTLPLPSYVTVKNLENGREVVVRVNDRGPFHSSRIIDLSYAAASKLDVIGKGTAKVEISVIPLNRAKNSEPSWFIQTGAFSQKRLANGMAKRLKEVVEEEMVNVSRAAQTYLVKLGPFPTQAKMLEAKTKLVKLGLKDSFSFLY